MKNKRFLSLAVAALSLFAGMTALGGNRASAAAEETDGSSGTTLESNEDISTRGLFTSLSLSINGGDGKVWATVRNDITIFPATVQVIVEIYYSEEYQESYENMTVADRQATTDLNMGKTIVAEASTNGRELYWQGRMRFKIDNKAWETRSTGTIHCGPDGEYLGII